MTKKINVKRRSWLAQSAHRSGAGPHQDRRDRRQGTRKQQTTKAIQEAAE